MKFFIDTANVEDIRKANDMGVICGVTTNPSLIAKEGRDFNEVIKEITTIVDGPISGEVKATTVDAEGMIKEGREIAAIPSEHGSQDPDDRRGIKGSQSAVRRGNQDECDAYFHSKPGASCSARRRNYVSPSLADSTTSARQVSI